MFGHYDDASSAYSGASSRLSKHGKNMFVPQGGLPFPLDPNRPAGIKTGIYLDYVPVAESVSASSVSSRRTGTSFSSSHVPEKILKKSIPGYTGSVPGYFVEDNLGVTFEKAKQRAEEVLHERKRARREEKNIFKEYMAASQRDPRAPAHPPANVLAASEAGSVSTVNHHPSSERSSRHKRGDYQVVDVTAGPRKSHAAPPVDFDASSMSGSYRSESTSSKAPSSVTASSSSSYYSQASSSNNGHYYDKYGRPKAAFEARRAAEVPLDGAAPSKGVKFTGAASDASSAYSGSSSQQQPNLFKQFRAAKGQTGPLPTGRDFDAQTVSSTSTGSYPTGKYFPAQHELYTHAPKEGKLWGETRASVSQTQAAKMTKVKYDPANPFAVPGYQGYKPRVVREAEQFLK